jgi:hypothetical protein
MIGSDKNFTMLLSIGANQFEIYLSYIFCGSVELVFEYFCGYLTPI